MRFTRIRSCHIGVGGKPYDAWSYRVNSSYTHHWGTYANPLVRAEGVTSVMFELTYMPIKFHGWQFSSTIASDYSSLIGNNIGGMLTVRRVGLIVE